MSQVLFSLFFFPLHYDVKVAGATRCRVDTEKKSCIIEKRSDHKSSYDVDTDVERFEIAMNAVGGATKRQKIRKT